MSVFSIEAVKQISRKQSYVDGDIWVDPSEAI